VVTPPPRAQILVDADLPRQVPFTSKVGDDESQMSILSNDRIVPIALALMVRTGMDMNIGDDRQAVFSAVFPNSPELSAIEFDDSARKASGIDVVVK
jgi:hypothetical protein